MASPAFPDRAEISWPERLRDGIAELSLVVLLVGSVITNEALRTADSRLVLLFAIVAIGYLSFGNRRQDSGLCLSLAIGISTILLAQLSPEFFAESTTLRMKLQVSPIALLLSLIVSGAWLLEFRGKSTTHSIHVAVLATGAVLLGMFAWLSGIVSGQVRLPGSWILLVLGLLLSNLLLVAGVTSMTLRSRSRARRLMWIVLVCLVAVVAHDPFR